MSFARLAEPAITRWRPRVAQGLAFTLLFVSAWIVVPAPFYALLPLSVGAPEVAHLLLVGSLFNVMLALDVYQLPDGDTHPVVLQIYGGGWRSGTRDSNAAFARALAGAGYVVFAID